MGLLDGRVALVTGASRGIGLAIALELARVGAAVVLNHHPKMPREDVEAAEQAVGAIGGKWTSIVADVSDAADVRAMVDKTLEELGRLDVLVNNAGITRDRTLLKQTDEEWDEVLRVNLTGVRHCTRAAAAAMARQGWGRIVNISSVVGQAGAFGQTNYAASKGGVIAFTKAAALELARSGILVNAICPGYVETPMTAAIPEMVSEDIRKRIPLGRFAHPEEIARVVRFLASEADYITGAAIPVNGGYYM
jgi:acetoacetyl-CoA reductase